MKDIKSERLATALQRSGLSQIELCKKAGVTAGALSSYLSGRYFPKQKTLERLADALSVSIIYLMGLDEPSSSSDDADSLFIEKYGRDLFDLAMNIDRLDDRDQGKVEGFVESMLQSPKYQNEIKEKADSDIARSAI